MGSLGGNMAFGITFSESKVQQILDHWMRACMRMIINRKSGAFGESKISKNVGSSIFAQGRIQPLERGGGDCSPTTGVRGG